MSDFCIVCVTRSGSYYIMEYMCRVFGLAEGNEWFGRNKEVDLTKSFELKQKRLDIDFNVNEDLLSDQDIKDRLKHLENFPVPYCIKSMPLQFTNTIESLNFPIEKRIEVAQDILDNFDLVWFTNENKISHFCYELTSILCSSKGYSRDREYSTYSPEKRVTPPDNSFTASLKDFDRFMKREEFTDAVMEPFTSPVVTYGDFVKNQDKEMQKIADYYDLQMQEVYKIPIIPNPDYTKIFTNYSEIEKWFTQYQR